VRHFDRDLRLLALGNTPRRLGGSPLPAQAALLGLRDLRHLHGSAHGRWRSARRPLYRVAYPLPFAFVIAVAAALLAVLLAWWRRPGSNHPGSGREAAQARH
jgi:hypothetical protein